MDTKYWIKRFVKFFAIVAVGLFVIYLFKGYRLENAIYGALVWAGITSCLFTLSRIYYVKQGIRCDLCDDIPAKDEGVQDKATKL